MALLYPKAIHDIRNIDGGSLIGGPPRCTVHTTETHPRNGPFTSTIYYSIQFVEWPAGTVKVYQHIQLDRASRALFNGPHPVQTNRMGKYHPNIAIVGYAKDSPKLSTAMINALADYFVWQEKVMRIPAVFPLTFQGSEAYGVSGAGRMSVNEWANFTGICGHQDVPDGNTHWDPGKLPVAKIQARINDLTGDNHMASYRGVTNVPSERGEVLPWAKALIDRHINRGVIRIDDNAPDDWARDGRLWIFLDRSLNPVESQLDTLENALNKTRSRVTQLENSLGSGDSGEVGRDAELRAYLRGGPS